ncbi:IPT/TIG domain-containing protein [Actinospica robiniae DSM 44927]|uniref:IPT/TIG domain-containing protein n=1 Tax=Actinospica robiniae DSM 44927 TaxID=479430 RepID=W9DVX6_9ACTN|nr:IPT/TIG domain-containing protein [Actinospica robiniae DSM 44927]
MPRHGGRTAALVLLRADDGRVSRNTRATAVRAGVRLFAGLCLLAGVSAAGPAEASSHPVIRSVSPATVDTDGGTVTVSGYGFTGTDSVKLLSLPSSTVTARPAYVYYKVISDDTLRLTVPTHTAGTVWISITTASGSNTYSSHDRLQFSENASTSNPPGKDTLGALLLAMLIGMIFGRNRDE